MRAFLLALVVLLVAALGWMSCVRRDRVAPLGEELVYDDFGFSVKDVQRSKTLWMVDLQVSNHAKRVAYKRDSHQAVIVDAEGRRYEPRSADTAGEIAHGESCVTHLVFDVPERAPDPRLKIRFGKVGSTLDYVLLGDWSLELH